MSDEAQYGDGGSAFDADLEGEEYGTEDGAEAFAGQDPAQLEQAAAEMLAEFPELEQPEVVQDLAEHARLQAEALGHPELSDDLGFWRTVHIARGGADPAGEPQGDEFDQALAFHGKGRNALPF